MKKDDSVYLRHILDAVGQIEEYTEGISRDEFFRTKLLQDGVIRQFKIKYLFVDASYFKVRVESRYVNRAFMIVTGMIKPFRCYAKSWIGEDIPRPLTPSRGSGSTCGTTKPSPRVIGKGSGQLMERINKELKRRSRVVGAYPDDQSFMRLGVSILIDINEDWLTGKKYLSWDED